MGMIGGGAAGAETEAIAAAIVDAAVKLHMRLGPGLLESVYESLLSQELRRRGLSVDRQVSVTFELDGLRFEEGFRADLIVGRCVLVELKAVEKLAPVHWRQVLTYLRLLDLRLGLLINFGGATLKQGLHRVLNDFRLSAWAPSFAGDHQYLTRRHEGTKNDSGRLPDPPGASSG